MAEFAITPAVRSMSQNPASEASAALSSLSLRLNSARTEESLCGDRIESIDADLALQRARFDAASPKAEHQRAVIAQRIAGLLELRSALMSERLRRRREIDELSQRKEAISAALSVLRAKIAAQPA